MHRRRYLQAIAGAAGIGMTAAPATGCGCEGANGRGPPRGGPPTGALFQSDREKLTRYLESAVANGVFPGVVASVVDEDGVLYRDAVGEAQVEPERREMTAETVFDLASLTKAVVTTTSVMQLVERDEVGLDDSLCDYYADLPGEKCDVTIADLLAHTSGLPAWQALWEEVADPDEAVGHVLRDVPLESDPGEEVTYSDLGFIVLGDLVRTATGTPLDDYAAANVFEPLGMDTTAYTPLETLPESHAYAATERSAYYDDEVVVGEVHDENAAFIGGVSGNAGLFSTVDDLSTFARTILNGGEANTERILPEETVDAMTRDRIPDLDATRGLGWDRREIFGTKLSGTPIDPTAFGHDGFTGTSVWFAPRLDIAVVTLTNRVHPSRADNRMSGFRSGFHNLVGSLVST